MILQTAYTPVQVAMWHRHEALCYLLYLAGQIVFTLKLADTAARGNNGVKTRSHYYELNWVTLLVRVFIIEILLWFAWTHQPVFVNEPWYPTWGPHWKLPQYAVLFPFMGYNADSAVDWLSTSPKVPAIIKAQIPALPQEMAMAGPLVEPPPQTGASK